MSDHTHVMVKLCESIKLRGVKYDRDADLPAPNLYLCSVYPLVTPAPFQSVHLSVCAGHTAIAMHKVANACADKHNFRPCRSNSTVKVRRLKLGDLIENPDNYLAALLLAKENRESDIITALRKLPGLVSVLTGVPLPAIDESAASSLWDTFADALSLLRPAR